MSYLTEGMYASMTTVSGSATSWITLISTCEAIHKNPICWILPGFLGYAYTATGDSADLGSSWRQIFSSCCVPANQELILYSKLSYLGDATILTEGGYPMLTVDNSAMSLKVVHHQ